MPSRADPLHLLLPLLLLCLSGCAPEPGKSLPPLRTVDQVDLERYLGEWYEIARYPNRFQEGCAASKAKYSRGTTGEIQVLNQCFDRGYRKPLRSVRGTARVVDRQSGAKLQVSFFWPFSGDYWIIELGNNYQYAVVGHPDRQKTMTAALFRQILERLPARGYDPAKLITTAEMGGGKDEPE